MLETHSENPTLSLAGIDQQDFSAIQKIQGAYPYQIGLQRRMPGKTIQQALGIPIGSILVFYMVYGRHYVLTDFGNIQITPVDPPVITLPGLPNAQNQWFDDFSGYSPAGLISNLWGAGAWADTVGHCETIIQGYFDPFLVYDNIAVTPPNTNDVPTPLPIPDEDQHTTPANPNSPGAMYPPGSVDLVIRVQTGDGDNSCEGQGTTPVASIDVINAFAFSGGPFIDSLSATSVTIGGKFNFHGKIIGRTPDHYVGIVQGFCPGPPMPDPLIYSLFINTNEVSQDS